ncbi:MAG TPA: hypothetical protein VFX17_03700 [Patescibacteria group bacterium]|nr:hypothetical protein [Patescibacteria group bacterium]
MKLVFPIIENKIFKPKVPFHGLMTEVGKETDSYGYEFIRWKLEPALKFNDGERDFITDEAITYTWK